MKQMTDYQRELVTTNMSVVDHVIRASIHVNNSALENYEDFYQIGCEALCKAAMSYNPSASAFAGGVFLFLAIVIVTMEGERVRRKELSELL